MCFPQLLCIAYQSFNTRRLHCTKQFQHPNIIHQLKNKPDISKRHSRSSSNDAHPLNYTCPYSRIISHYPVFQSHITMSVIFMSILRSKPLPIADGTCF